MRRGSRSKVGDHLDGVGIHALGLLDAFRLLWNPLWSRVHIVTTIQVVMDERTLRQADRAARRAGINRSRLIREAVRAHLAGLRERELDERHRRAYEEHPVQPGEFDIFEKEQVWPDD